MTSYLKLTECSKSFDQYHVFKNVDYQFESGKMYALVGPSGSGKTTLLNSIGRLEKLTAGSISFAGTDITTIPSLKYFRQFIGYLFQNYALVDEETVAQNLNIVKHYRTAELRDHLAKYGLDDTYLTRKIFTLSGGEAQRVALARLSLQDPLIVLADEPTGALDHANGQLVLDSLRTMTNSGKIVIIATHDDKVKAAVDKCVDITAFK
ncbi:ATP-binding cassette domain-containing protein [Pediococcus ethanolidurans]|uniref:ABC transport system ATP-binding protein n=1 Tax=Pediococcus ethanolidurans TaxID=319653 RepID=A0A0R2K900_9LACO|nr:ATP-binding cassette domain-containing protein [Pediococcus ethanolidurans]KRN83114.1 ABC transporter ATP-binding protein [Pediococcus ethanolidurans]GEN95099.1 ABC transporter ATP-binding protein [Pediococcus ethanolidurans]SER36695.1 putative ABC transport system ATP-binding protein [Pediococcus ethanolidurans]